LRKNGRWTYSGDKGWAVEDELLDEMYDLLSAMIQGEETASKAGLIGSHGIDG
jgi:hypothetical protein